MALATLFVTLPFVVRELIPILEAMDLSEEEAAKTMGASDWEVFWNVTLPNIRWGLLYGVILTNAVRLAQTGSPWRIEDRGCRPTHHGEGTHESRSGISVCIKLHRCVHAQQWGAS